VKPDNQKLKNRVERAQDKKQHDVAEFAGDMLLELRNLARKAELRTLSSLLELSYYEAFSVANRVQLPEGESERMRTLEKFAASL
jgi:repressor of nif and glnA expression